MPLYVRNQDTSEEIKSTNWGNDVRARLLSLSQTHTQTSASKMGQVKAVGVGWGGRAGRRGGPGPRSSLGARAHSASWHGGWQQLQGGVGGEAKHPPPAYGECSQLPCLLCLHQEQLFQEWWQAGRRG